MPSASGVACAGSVSASLREAERHGGARDEPAEQAREPDPVLGPDDLHQQVAREVQPRDQHDHQPDLVWVDHVERRGPEGPIRNERQDDDADDRELQRGLDVGGLDAAGEPVQPVLQRQHTAARDRETRSGHHVAAHAEEAEQEREQGRDLGGDAELTALRRDRVRHDHERRHLRRRPRARARAGRATRR